MNESGFRKWLTSSGQSEKSAGSRVSTALRVEKTLGDLEAILQNEGKEALLQRFAYGVDDQRIDAPNPSPVQIDGDLRTGLASLRQAISLYDDFLQQQSNMPNKVQLDQLISALTTADIIASMDDCDREGVDAFLGRYGFGRPQVWTKRPIDGEKSIVTEDPLYPAKAIVAFAIGILPNGQALTPKRFYKGAGEAQSFKCLTDLGFELIDKRKMRDQAALFTRETIETAMAAYDHYEQNGTQDEIFGAFGTPSDYWVRSTRSNPEKPYPTKPLVGFILEKTALHGGWGQKTDAAARLHNAGYIIVDENDDPVGPPERYSHLIKDADRIRLCAKNYHIDPARDAGRQTVSIRAGDLGKEMGLQDAHPNICNALLGSKFQNLTGLQKPTHTEPQPSSSTVFTFQLAGSHQRSQAETNVRAEKEGDVSEPRNLILYGPPGTGKTHTTAAEALRLCGEPVPTNRDEVMAAYNRLRSEKRIEFVTFHQSMSYEDFVEGRQPTTDPDVDGEAGTGFRLQTVPGVIRRMAEQAQYGSMEPDNENGLSLDGRQVFKMSIAAGKIQSEQYLFEEAIDEGHTLLGWEDIDFSDPKYADPEEILKVCTDEGRREGPVTKQSGQVALVDAFRNQVQIGDILVVTKGNSVFRAIGEVTGEYYYKQRDSRKYSHRRAVKWLWVDREGRPSSEIYDSNFTMRSIYRLQESKLKNAALTRLMNSSESFEEREPVPYVLIIDEINRANISKVFGELITLIEPDKRLGMPNALTVRLPYSGDEFGIPKNLHILGTMNTADRSIALLDTALRRRFEFREIKPNPDLLHEASRRCDLDLPRILTVLNERIEYLYDREHQIGHAYLMGCSSRADVDHTIRYKIIPLLAEYFFEDWDKVAVVLGDAQTHDRPIMGGFMNRAVLKAPPGLDGDFDGPVRFRWTIRDTEVGFDYSGLIG